MENKIRDLTDMDQIFVENITTNVEVVIFKNHTHKISYKVKNIGHNIDVYEFNLKIKYKSETNINKKFYIKIVSDRSSYIIKRVNKIINILNLLVFSNKNIENEINNIDFKVKIYYYKERNGFGYHFKKWKLCEKLKFSKIIYIFD